jgi:hypothetical protein
MMRTRDFRCAARRLYYTTRSALNGRALWVVVKFGEHRRPAGAIRCGRTAETAMLPVLAFKLYQYRFSRATPGASLPGHPITLRRVAPGQACPMLLSTFYRVNHYPMSARRVAADP